MRFSGLYAPDSIADFATLIGDHTPEMIAAIAPLQAQVEAAIAEYNAAWPEVCVLQPLVWSKVDHDILVAAYDRRTVAIKRRLATMLKTLAPAHQDLCPFCNLDTGAELDHYLPKDIFAEFSLNSINLVPICGQCNKSKRSSYKNNKGDRLFVLPLFDLDHNEVFLDCGITFDPDPRIEFFIHEFNDLTEPEFELCQRHFERLRLNDRFSRRALSYLSSVKQNLRGGNANDIEDTVRSTFESGAQFDPLNSWRSALFRVGLGNIDEIIEWIMSEE